MTTPTPKPPIRDLLNVQLDPETRRMLEELRPIEAARTGERPERVAGQLVRRLIRDEHRKIRRKSAASP